MHVQTCPYRLCLAQMEESGQLICFVLLDNVCNDYLQWLMDDTAPYMLITPFIMMNTKLQNLNICLWWYIIQIFDACAFIPICFKWMCFYYIHSSFNTEFPKSAKAGVLALFSTWHAWTFVFLHPLCDVTTILKTIFYS